MENTKHNSVKIDNQAGAQSPTAHNCFKTGSASAANQGAGKKAAFVNGKKYVNGQPTAAKDYQQGFEGERF